MGMSHKGRKEKGQGWNDGRVELWAFDGGRDSQGEVGRHSAIYPFWGKNFHGCLENLGTI